MIWIGGTLYAFIDNIPVTTTFIPVVKDLSLLTGINIAPLWWTLLYGVCFGRNFTLIASAPWCYYDWYCKKEGYNISSKEFVKIAAPLAVLQLLISSIFVIAVFWE